MVKQRKYIHCMWEKWCQAKYEKAIKQTKKKKKKMKTKCTITKFSLYVVYHLTHLIFHMKNIQKLIYL